MQKALLALLISTAYAENLALDPIIVRVEANFDSYDKANAISSRNIGNKSKQNLDTIIRSVSGSYTQMDPGQGSISVNIRNLSGLGRVNTMIDGVPQTQIGTSAKKGKYHEEGNGPISQFGALIDPNFLTRVDISKGKSDGSAGINALAGSANFRTIEPDDVINADKNYGFLIRGNYGNNDLGNSGMAAVAFKAKALQNNSISSLFAFSASEMNQNYRRGDGSHSTDSTYIRNLKQEPRSYLGKINIYPNSETQFNLQSRAYQNNLSGRKIKAINHQLGFKYNPHDLIDFNALVATNHTKQIYSNESSLWTINGAKTHNKMRLFDFYNKFNIHHLTSIVGLNMMDNRYTRYVGENNDPDAVANLAMGSQGQQNIKALYWNNEFKHDDLTLNGSLIYQRAQLKGIKPPCADDETYCFPKGELAINRIYSTLNPSLGLSYKIENFEPFINYYHTSRAPNVQEIFNTSRNAVTVNPFLKPERSRTHEMGINFVRDNNLFQNDYLGIKAVYFNGRIKDYIYNAQYFACKNGQLCTDINNLHPTDVINAQIYTNSLQRVKNRGWEIELNYDGPYFFSNLSYTHNKSNAPTSIGSSITNGFGLEPYSQQPKYHADLELGTYLIDRKLMLSSIFKFTGQGKRVHIEATDNDGNMLVENLPKIPMIIDVYGNYNVTKNLNIRASIQNVMDKNYMNVLDAYNSSGSEEYDSDSDTYKFTNTARGRTYTIEFEYKF